MAEKDSFFSIHRQGFVRVASCTPRLSVADPTFNVAETLTLAKEGHAQGADQMPVGA